MPGYVPEAAAGVFDRSAELFRSLVGMLLDPATDQVTHGDLEQQMLERGQALLRSGGPGESRPRAPADPGVTVSRHRALLILLTRMRGPTASARSTSGTGWLPVSMPRALS